MSGAKFATVRRLPRRVAAQAVGLALFANAIAVFLLHWPCRNSGYTDSQFTSFCYSDLAALFANPPLKHGDWPFGAELATSMAPVPTFLTWLVAQLTTDFTVRMVTMQLLLLACLAVVAAVVFRSRPWRRLDAALLLLLPLWPFVMFVSVDLISVAAAAVALFAWQRSRPVIAALALGVALASSGWTWLLLLVFLVDAIRADRRVDIAVTAGISLALAAALCLPRLLAGDSFLIPVDFTPGEGSPLYVNSLLSGTQPPNGLFIAIAGAAICLAIARWAVHLPFDFRLEPLLALMVCVQLLTGPGIPPQSLTHLLWLLPLVKPELKFGLVFSLLGFGYVAAVWLRLEGLTPDSHGLSGLPYGVLAALLWLALLWVAAIARRIIQVQGVDIVEISRAAARS